MYCLTQLYSISSVLHTREGKSAFPLPLELCVGPSQFLQRRCRMCDLEGRNERAEMEATLKQLLLGLLASTTKEAFGSVVALVVWVNVLWLHRRSEAACGICLLVHVRAEAVWSCSQQGMWRHLILRLWLRQVDLEPAVLVEDSAKWQKQQPILSCSLDFPVVACLSQPSDDFANIQFHLSKTFFLIN